MFLHDFWRRSVGRSVNHSLFLLLNATSMRWLFLLGLPLGAQVGLPQGAHWVGLPLGAHPHLAWKLHFVCRIIIIISICQSGFSTFFFGTVHLPWLSQPNSAGAKLNDFSKEQPRRT